MKWCRFLDLHPNIQQWAKEKGLDQLSTLGYWGNFGENYGYSWISIRIDGLSFKYDTEILQQIANKRGAFVQIRPVDSKTIQINITFDKPRSENPEKKVTILEMGCEEALV